jgi:hypothetical protein
MKDAFGVRIEGDSRGKSTDLPGPFHSLIQDKPMSAMHAVEHPDGNDPAALRRLLDLV